MPSFYALKNAYAVDKTHLGRPHMDEYYDYNVERSKCPDDFPSIHQFKWAADNHFNSTVACPAKKKKLGEVANIEAKCHGFKYKHDKDFEEEWSVSAYESSTNHVVSWFPLSIFVGI